MTDQELKNLVTSLAISQKETDKQLKGLGKQIGGLGNKFGSFTEGMAFPSMKKILRDYFHMENIAANVSVRKAEGVMELDVLAYANTEVNAVYVVEVKSNLRESHLSRFLENLKRFPEFFPKIYKGKEVYGVLSGAASEEAASASGVSDTTASLTS